MVSKALCTILFLAVSAACFSQTSIYHRYIIEFTDKENNPYSLDNPSEYLSQRALDRRSRYSIAITSNDLPITPGYIEQVSNTGVKILNKSKWLNSISIETDDSLALLEIKSFSFVKSAGPIAPRIASKIIGKKAESVSVAEKAAGNNVIDYGKSSDEIDMINGNSLHVQGFRGEGMIIAVLDVGFYNAPNLAVFDSIFTEGRVLGWWNFVKGTDSVFYDGTHGTAVLSTIAANIPGTMVGTAPDASFYLFESEDNNSEYPIEEHNWAAAAERADSIGVDIITSSLGYSRFDDPLFNHSYSDMDGNTTMVSRAADFAASKGMIVCSSAGNEGNSDWYYITAPADADSILTVGAVDSIGVNTVFSSHGPSADGDIKPNVVAQGLRTTVVEPFSGAIVTSNGTSFSNPIIAGMTACLWQAHQDKNNMEIIQAIEKSSSLYYTPNDSMGYGIPNFQVADLLLSEKAPANLPFSDPLVYPNPFSDTFGILYYSSDEQQLQGRFFNMLGEEIQSFKSPLQIGYNFLSIDHLNKFPIGIYFLKLEIGDQSQITKMIKVSH